MIKNRNTVHNCEIHSKKSVIIFRRMAAMRQRSSLWQRVLREAKACSPSGNHYRRSQLVEQCLYIQACERLWRQLNHLTVAILLVWFGGCSYIQKSLLILRVLIFFSSCYTSRYVPWRRPESKKNWKWENSYNTLLGPVTQLTGRTLRFTCPSECAYLFAFS